MQYNKLFISYAKEDIGYAQGLYNFLLSKNFDPWLDKKKLLPGQDWEFHLSEALHKADFIILILSQTSIAKRGYVQKEFRKALEYCEYKLDSDIFVIPVKIDDCEVPLKLQKFQWVQFDQNAFQEILNSIEHQRKSMLEEAYTINISNQAIGISEQIKQGEYGTISPKHLYEFYYPQFVSPTTESLIELNTIIANDSLKSLLNVRNNYFEYLAYDGSNNALDPDNPEDSTTYGKIEISFINSYFVSFTFFISEYHTGAAHGMYGSIGKNYYSNPIREFKFIDLFNERENYLQTIRNLVDEKLMDLLEEREVFYSDENGSNNYTEMSIEAKRSSFYIFDELLPKEENFENYYFTNKSLVFIYNPYDIAAWSAGAHYPEISFEEMLIAFPEERKLHDFISILSIHKYTTT